jgi:hypothetical protein
MGVSVIFLRNISPCWETNCHYNGEEEYAGTIIVTSDITGIEDPNIHQVDLVVVDLPKLRSSRELVLAWDDHKWRIVSAEKHKVKGVVQKGEYELDIERPVPAAVKRLRPKVWSRD